MKGLIDKTKAISLKVGLIFSVGLLFSNGLMAGSIKDYSDQPLGKRSVLSERAISERIAPIGDVCVEGEDCGSSAVEEESAPAARSGQQVVQTACFGCHGTGAGGAPKMGDGSWKALADKGVDVLLANAIKGLNAMPPKGLCMDCSDDELKAAIEYMIEQ